tara:strand:- start:6002 stop:7294 length:1293 start_codon:yes stop_codon:yes gene_type:complete
VKLSKESFSIIYLLLLTGAIFTPRFGVWDKMTIQLFWLSLSNILAIISIPLVFKEISYKKVIQNPLIICYAGYLVMCILSMVKSINLIESLVRFFQLVTFFISLCIIVFLAYNKTIRLKNILWIILLTLVIDLAYSYYMLYSIIVQTNFTYDFNWLLVGLHGNRNILSAAILFRIPLVIILITLLKNKPLKTILFLIITLAFLDVYLLSSRMALLSIIVCILFIIMILFYNLYKTKNHIISFSKPVIMLYILPCVLAYMISAVMIDSSDQGDVSNRLYSIASTNDDSKNTRLRYYTHLIDHISKNPFLGSGIGTWKLYSIKYDRVEINNYIIPYNAHNDILEVSAETGVIGGVFFTSFFGFLFWGLYKNLRLYDKKPEDYYFWIFMTLPLIVYFIDVNLNFPSSRPFNQYLLLLYIYILVSPNLLMNEKK